MPFWEFFGWQKANMAAKFTKKNFCFFQNLSNCGTWANMLCPYRAKTCVDTFASIGGELGFLLRKSKVSKTLFLRSKTLKFPSYGGVPEGRGGLLHFRGSPLR